MTKAKKVTAVDILNVGGTAKETLGKLLAKGKQVTDVVSVEKAGKEWHVMLEVLERKAVPDIQDILGKYELKLDGDGVLLGYKRVELRRRGDLGAEE